MPQLPVPATAPGVADLDALFRGFADPTRLRILNALVPGELCVGDIVEVLDLPQPTVSRHLAYLRRAGLVEVARERTFARYRLADAEHPVHRSLVDCVRDCFRGIRSLDLERDEAARRSAQRADCASPDSLIAPHHPHRIHPRRAMRRREAGDGRRPR